jgi:hypothetical protein
MDRCIWPKTAPMTMHSIKHHLNQAHATTNSILPLIEHNIQGYLFIYLFIYR